VDARTRAALEGALEASGLLAAEVHGDGTLQLADGQLVASPDTEDAEAPLSALLVADIPDADGVQPETREAVDRILRTISTDPTTQAGTVVTVDGEFRIGAVRGRYVKDQAEHIGLTARRAALERLRAENALALAEARAQRERLADEVATAGAALEQAVALRAQVPPDQGLHTALWKRNEAERSLDKAEEQLRLRRSERQSAEQQHSDVVEYAVTTASRLSLPTALTELRSIRNDLEALISDSREAARDLAHLARAVARWRDRGDEWRAAREDEETSKKHLDTVSAELRLAKERLATLDATIGAAYEEIVAEITRRNQQLSAGRESLITAENDMKQAVRDVTAAEKDRESAAAARERADAECTQTFEMLRRALTVAGLIEAAVDAPNSELQGIAAAASDIDDPAAGSRHLVETIRARVPRPEEPPTSADGVRQSIRRRRDSLGAGWDAEDRQPAEHLPLHIEVTGPLAQQTPLPAARQVVQHQLATMTGLLSTKQHQALRNLLQGLVAREIAEKLHAAGELIERMNDRLSAIKTSHGIGVKLRWRRRDDLDPTLAETIALLAKPPDLRTAEEDRRLSEALGHRIDEAHREDPGTPYRDLIARVLDYREWHAMTILLQRPGRAPERLSRRTALSEGEKKIVTYLPLFAAVAASCDALAASEPEALRFVLLDDAFAKVSEDNHPKLFGLLVELDLDFIATSERLWGTHDTVPELAITEVIRDADLQTIVLEHSRWNGVRKELAS
jgi:hypothetical protein